MDIYFSQHLGIQITATTPDMDTYDSGPNGIIDPDVDQQTKKLFDVPGLEDLVLDRVQRFSGSAQYSFVYPCRICGFNPRIHGCTRTQCDFVPDMIMPSYYIKANGYILKLKEINDGSG